MTRTPQTPNKGGVAAPAFFLCLVAAGAGFALDFNSSPIFGLPAAWIAVALGAGAALFALGVGHLLRFILKAPQQEKGEGDAGAHP